MWIASLIREWKIRRLTNKAMAAWSLRQYDISSDFYARRAKLIDKRDRSK